MSLERRHMLIEKRNKEQARKYIRFHCKKLKKQLTEKIPVIRLVITNEIAV